MTEETNAPTQGTEPEQQASFTKPEWLVKTEKLKEAVKQGLGAQVVFRSDNNVDCEPQLASEPQSTTVYPTVVE